MLTEAELLQYIYQTTEMGRDGIQSVLPHAEDETFHQALEQQSMKSSTAPPERCCGNVVRSPRGSIPWSRHPPR